MRRPEVQSHEPVIEGWIGWPSYGVDKLPGGKLPYLVPCLAMPYYAARQKASGCLRTTRSGPIRATKTRNRRASNQEGASRVYLLYPESIDGSDLGFTSPVLVLRNKRRRNCKETRKAGEWPQA